jgi:hypothetical protein
MNNTHKSAGFFFKVLVRMFERMLPELLGTVIVDAFYAGLATIAWNFVMPHAFGSNTISVLHAYALMWLIHIVFFYSPGPAPRRKKSE